MKTNTSKKIHLVFFVDASEPRSFTFSAGVFRFIVAALFLLGGLSVGALVAYTKQTSRIARSENYIRELTSGMVAYAATNKIAQSEAVAGSGHHFETLEKTLAEIRESSKTLPSEHKDPNQDLAQLLAESKKIDNLDKATLSLAAASGAAPSPESGATQPDSLDPQADKLGSSSQSPETTTSVANEAGSAKTEPAKSSVGMKNAAPTNSRTVTAGSEIVRFQGFEIAADSDRGEKALLTFNLVNSQPEVPQGGRVCAIAKVVDASGRVNFESYPPKSGISNKTLKIDGVEVPLPSDCRSGEPVRFSRLRPTEVEFQARPQDIVAVGVLYVDSPTKRVHSGAWRFK